MRTTDSTLPPAASPTSGRKRRTPHAAERRRRARATSPGWSGPAIVAAVFGVAGLVGVAGATLSSALERPNRATAVPRWHLRRIADEIARYRREVGRLPPSLDALAFKDARAARGLVIGRDAVPLDPWGAPYAYAVLDERRATYELRSAGDDRVLGTTDDIVATLP